MYKYIKMLMDTDFVDTLCDRLPSDYGEKLNLLTENEEKLYPLLSDKAAKLFNEIQNTQLDANTLEKEGYFIAGFQMGVNLMLESLFSC